ncbi:MAG: hypothetical protein GF308_05585 [Candidatus Heimdallarchaeota archaeon]|nr:hypothetical protein [Candidatus Heimdallarchaeota archaeon]
MKTFREITKNGLLLFLASLLIFSFTYFSTNILLSNAIVQQSSNDPFTTQLTTKSIFDNDTVWENVQKDLSESVTITNGGNLTIINSHINFTATESGFILENESILNIRDSIIEFGDTGIAGTTNGTLILNNATFANFTDDVISLEGDYSITVDNSKFLNNQEDGIDIEDITAPVEVSNTLFENSGKDGIKIDDVTLLVNNCQFIGQNDEGLQIEGDSPTSIINSVILDNVGNAIKIEEHEGTICICNVTIQNCQNDGIDISNSQTDLTIQEVTVDNSDGTGLEIDDLHSSVTIDDSTFTRNIIGIDIYNATTLTMVESVIDDNEEHGLILSTIFVVDIQYSNITNNPYGGLLAVDLQQSDAHYNRFVGNGIFAINATGLGTGKTFNATHNYWGTLNEEEIDVLGSVDIDPILNNNLEEIQSSTPPTTSTPPSTTETPSESETSATPYWAASLFIGLIFLATLSNLIVRKKRKEK